jgi:hypothetical protein
MKVGVMGRLVGVGSDTLFGSGGDGSLCGGADIDHFF